ncbi:MAG: HAMP domain-containing protein [Acidobacteriia bacterium]|nr:HAMP domain-containing protein [Terriglobia bacterium]
MRLLRSIRLGLAAKLAVCVIASTSAFFALFGYLNLGMERRHSQDLVEQSAYRITDVIVRSTHYEMLNNDQKALYNIIQELGTEPGIQRIRIFNKDGLITYSTDARELRTVVNKTAEGCIGCHAQSAPLAKLSRRDRARYFTDKEGHRVLGVMRPIDNQPECSNAACHVHKASQRILGVIDSDLSLATVDDQIAQHQANLRWFLLGAIVFGCGAAVLFMWVVVYRPVKKLIAGTHRVAGGDLNYRLPAGSGDELGDLAASFNKMTAEVAGVQAHIEEQVRRKTAELERVHKTLLSSEKMASIGKLAATVAHEINNPLFGILTYARLVARELSKHEIPGRDEMAEQLQTIERESKRCGDLVKNLLTFSRQAPSHREPNDLNTIVHRAILLVKHRLDMQSIELQESLAEGLPPVECDANQIQQVILVLMVNASEAMPKGGTLSVATEFDAAAEQGSVSVKDTGSGIPADVLPRIFDPFFTTKEDQHRTGLGLAVAHSIVEQHAGEISVRSTLGEGTEFRVTLPVAGQPLPHGRGPIQSRDRGTLIGSGTVV